MAAKLFQLPYTCVVVNGIAQPGAKLYFYETGTTTPQSVYTTSALSVAHPNPVVANSAGKFADIYFDNALTYRIKIKNKNGTQLDDIDPVIPGVFPDASVLQPYQDVCEDSAASAAADAATAAAAAAVAVSAEAGVLSALGDASLDSVSLNAADRTALKALDTSLGFPALFDGNIWEVVAYADVSTLVTADTPEGIYCRSTFDTANVWVRQFDGPAQSTWFGVSPSASAANNYAYFTAALAVLKALALTSYGNNTGGIGLHTPTGHYSFNNTLSPDHQLEISGDFTRSGGGTVFEWTASVHGFEVLGSGHGNGTTIRGLYLKGNNGGTAKHAINQAGNLKVEDCYFYNWSGDGVHADSTSGGLSGSEYRSLNGDTIGWTLYLQGPDSNGCSISDVSAASNRFGNIFDSSGVGNVIVGGVTNSVGRLSGFVTRCHLSGHIYSVAYGQETAALTNSPSGTTASNTYWNYVEEGSVQTYQPAWVSGMGGITLYFSATICVEPADGNVRTIIVGHYAETGCNPILMSDKSQVIGGQILVPVLHQQGGAHGGYMYADRYYMKFNNGISTVGDVLVGGDLWVGGTLAISSARAAALASTTIGGGTTVTKVAAYSPSITPSSVGSATVAEQTFTVSGLTTADKVIVNPPSIANATGIVGARVSATDTLAIRFINPTAGSLTPTSGTYKVIAIRS